MTAIPSATHLSIKQRPFSLSKKYFVMKREQHARQRASNRKLQQAAIFIKTRDMRVDFLYKTTENCARRARFSVAHSIESVVSIERLQRTLYSVLLVCYPIIRKAASGRFRC